MKIDHKILAHLKKSPGSTTVEIAAGINECRCSVVYGIARLLWQMKVEMIGYQGDTLYGHQKPRYSLLTEKEVMSCEQKTVC